MTTMERGSTKHGRRLDEEQKHETQGIVQGGDDGRAEEWKEPEPLGAPGEEDLASTPRPPAHEPGSPEGMSPEDVDRRSNLARWISGVHAFPADRATLIARAEEQSAPDPVLSAVRSLPDRTFENMEDVADALGFGGEQQRD
ncbi:hypothetical protein FHS43_002236 [Streptosporangium becharense]|uniref:DUF2795 domain-containing protein n=1 Tax=Streptosporangium becharense TaxID=1816182 RepID=A0A7W9IJX3_9ACTN|nr:DUF2795 domain-containing protein [Streptosporangium becharense]MBB2910971.1 hypothetical protein [Streptosporangium becharense]MBB5821971.1 hypothetical protein [Streptosporangium becharense]